MPDSAVLTDASTKEVRVFYSWQSDSPADTNRNAIRKALTNSARKVELARTGITIIPDEATRNVPGSPNIVAKILEKIDTADIFLADITTVTPLGAPRACPNPNVTYELGYAVAQLGWDRIILLFNKALGRFPDDLPFDFAQHRAKPYDLAEAPSGADINDLAAFLVTAILAVIDQHPKRPSELVGVPREKLEHDHDVQTMSGLMSRVHLPTMDDFIEDLPKRVSMEVFWFWETFNGIVSQSLFYLYDPILAQAVRDLHASWLRAVSYGDEYVSLPGGKTFQFYSVPGQSLTSKQRAAWKDLDETRWQIKAALNALLERLRSSYLEIKIADTNAAAWKAYVDYHNN